eukprot:TRINITY_DN23065_c0_g1_i1.p1 TRINITY_DN23065_c0_g1~~TRINITY_DN23065_c0_g1_i1.p1  ORF type:complete len:734 (-),score=118.49 TRINITY_DN23065_c0_g1_i1:190-2274(-)
MGALIVRMVTCTPFLRKSHKIATAAFSLGSDASRLGRLLADVDKSIKSAGEDAEFVFSQLHRYDQKLETSIGHEIKLLNRTCSQLVALQAQYRLSSKSLNVELSHLDAVVGQSKKIERRYQMRVSHVSSRVEPSLRSIRKLIALLRSAEISRIHRVPQRSKKAIRTILGAHKELRTRFDDVFHAWLQLKTSAATQAPALLRRTADALVELRNNLRKRSTKALLQVESRSHQLASDEAKAISRSDAARDAQALRERKAEEVAFSTLFTQAILRADMELFGKLQEHMRASDGLVEAIRATRSSQLTTLYDLIDLVDDRFSSPTITEHDGFKLDSSVVVGGDAGGSTYMDDDSPESFLQNGLVGGAAFSTASATSVSDQTSASVSTGLRSEIDKALHDKANTHSILLRVQAMLDHAAPLDAGGVQEVLSKMGSALRAIDEDRASGDEALRVCEDQQFQSTQEEQLLRDSIKRTGASRKHTESAIRAASRNLQSIAAKVNVLNKTSIAFAQLAASSAKALGGHQRDRLTIISAVRRAQVVAPRVVVPTKIHAAGALLGQLLSLMQRQEAKERAFSAQQISLKAAFDAYRKHYLELLDERRSHYADALSALELYESELAGDVATRTSDLEEEVEVLDQGKKLCKTVLAFFNRHASRRVEVTRALRNILPKLPDIVNDATADNSDPTEVDGSQTVGENAY